MAKYQAPEGYVLDPNTGLYYTQIVAYDDAGNQVQVVNWFNADTGEYRQEIYPVKKEAEPVKRETPSEAPKSAPIKKHKPIALIVTLSAVVIGLGVCGYLFKDQIRGFVSVNETAGTETDITYAESSEESAGEASQYSEAVDDTDWKMREDIFEIYVPNDMEGYFVFHAGKVGLENIQQMSFEMGEFSVGLDDFDETKQHFQCSVWKKAEPISPEAVASYEYYKDAEYYTRGSDIIVHVKAFEDEAFNFKEPFGECYFHYRCYDDFSEHYTFTWNDYAVDYDYPLDGAVLGGLEKENDN